MPTHLTTSSRGDANPCTFDHLSPHAEATLMPTHSTTSSRGDANPYTSDRLKLRRRQCLHTRPPQDETHHTRTYLLILQYDHLTLRHTAHI